jgi:ribosomal protein L19E
MKKITLLVLLLIISSAFAQTDYSKFSKDELISKLKSKEIEIKALKESLDQEKKAKEKKRNENTSTAKNEIDELTKIIEETNAVFLREIFDAKYIKNTTYFKDTDLANENNTEKFKNSNVLINSIKVKQTNSLLDICNKALDFNKNYLDLFSIKDNVLNKKFDEIKVLEAIKTIENLPELESESKLNIKKMKIVNLLKNYSENICLLRNDLDKLKTKKDQKSLAPTYLKLEKDNRYKDYPFLLSIVSEMRKDVNSYTNDDLQCAEINKTPIETSNAETKI